MRRIGGKPTDCWRRLLVCKIALPALEVYEVVQSADVFIGPLGLRRMFDDM